MPGKSNECVLLLKIPRARLRGSDGGRRGEGRKKHVLFR